MLEQLSALVPSGLELWHPQLQARAGPRPAVASAALQSRWERLDLAVALQCWAAEGLPRHVAGLILSLGVRRVFPSLPGSGRYPVFSQMFWVYQT